MGFLGGFFGRFFLLPTLLPGAAACAPPPAVPASARPAPGFSPSHGAHEDPHRVGGRERDRPRALCRPHLLSQALDRLRPQVFAEGILLTCLLIGDELPVVPLGPLGECLPRVVMLHPSILPLNLFPFREEQPVVFVTSLEATRFFTFFTWLGILFQFSVTLLEKKLVFPDLQPGRLWPTI